MVHYFSACLAALNRWGFLSVNVFNLKAHPAPALLGFWPVSKRASQAKRTRTNPIQLQNGRSPGHLGLPPWRPGGGDGDDRDVIPPRCLISLPLLPSVGCSL
jgi:hypothetical protein